MAWRKATKPSHHAFLHGAGWDCLHTHSVGHLFVSPLQDGGELHSSVSGSGSGEAGYISQMLTWIQLASLLQFLPQW